MEVRLQVGYSGVPIAYGGEPVWYKRSIDPVYEKELIFKVENGIVVDHEVVKNELPFQINLFYLIVKLSSLITMIIGL